MTLPLEGYNRCPACKATTDADDWEIGGSDPGYQFCPACGVECEPISLYLESLGCEQSGRINHEGPAKAEKEMATWIREEFTKRRAAAEAARPTSCKA